MIDQPNNPRQSGAKPDAAEIQAAAHEYLARGWQSTPTKGKDAYLPKWQHGGLTEDRVASTFQPGDNLGLVLGEPSGGLTDVDLDCPEAIAVADWYLPKTGAEFGKASTPRCHRLYVTGGGKRVEFKDPTRTGKGAMLAELRCNGCQTMASPSRHPDTDEPIVWATAGEPARVDYADLLARVARVAAASLIARHWPERGSRHGASLALAGGLLRAGWSVDDAAHFVDAVTTVAGDEELRDRLAAVRDTADKLASGQPVTGWPTLAGMIGDAVVDLVCKWLALPRAARSDESARKADADAKPERKTQTARLLELAEASGAELWHTKIGVGHVTVPINGHYESWPIRRKTFRQWLARLLWEAERKAAGGQALQDAIDALDAAALTEGEEHAAYRRVAGHDGNIYIDLCDDAWRAIEVRPDGWRVVDRPPSAVRFVRGAAMMPLPMPERGGSLESLKPYLNVTGDDWTMERAWILSTFRPDDQHCPLILAGRAGSGKTDNARILQALTDPTALSPRSLPAKADDLYIACAGAHVVHIDNVSYFPKWLSDEVCRVTDGASSTKRQLYADADEVILSARNPLILTGIGDFAAESDLLDRAIRIELAPIPASERRTEAVLWDGVRAALPGALGGVLDCLVCALRRLPDTTVDDPGRRAGFCQWVSAAEPALGLQDGDFMRAYRGMAAASLSMILEESVIAQPLIDWLKGQERDDAGRVTTTARALRQALTDPFTEAKEKPPEGWPPNHRALSTQLDETAAALESAGVYFRRKKVHGERHLEFRVIENRGCFASPNGVLRHPDGTEDPPRVTQNGQGDAKHPLKSNDPYSELADDARPEPWMETADGQPVFEVGQ